MPTWTNITCPAGRHVQSVAGKGTNEKRVMRELGCADCRREQAEIDALFSVEMGAPSVSRSDATAGDRDTLRAARRNTWISPQRVA